jgi:hypothetical protein
MSDAIDPAELFDVEMDQLSRVVALVADGFGLGLERTELA